MRALSLWQPWASAMALGLKKIETRHWSTSYRGPIVIHASKRWTREEREFWEDMRLLYKARATPLPETVPLGAIVAIGNLVDVRTTESLAASMSITQQEEYWGNYGPGRFGWVFDRIWAFEDPIPYKGHQGFFDVPSDVLPPHPFVKGAKVLAAMDPNLKLFA